MTDDVRIWGRVHQVGPHEFVAIGSTVSDCVERMGEGANVEVRLFTTLDDALDGLHELVEDLGRKAVAYGKRVVDVESD